MVDRVTWRAAVAALLTVLLVRPAYAAEMCAPGENPVYCAMIEQRNNAFDEMAQAEGARRILAAKRAAEQAWWHDYVAGLPDVPALKKQILEEEATKHEAERAWWHDYAAGLPDVPALKALVLEEMAKHDAERAWWHDYVAGVPDLMALKVHLRAVCAWKGVQNTPTVKLCEWFKEQPK